MWRWLWFALLFPALCWAQDSMEMSWLDNRFRVDPTIEQASFLIHREYDSTPVVLVRPDGTKYYAWKHPENVSWYQEDGMDIISIENPMPGPWQAVGKVTPKNKITLLSNLKLEIEPLPVRLYKGETLKFSARLLQGEKLLENEDFLDRVSLKIAFTEYLENHDDLPKEVQPEPIELGEFFDDGKGLDEQAGDGVFTLALSVNINPGKYRVRFSSGNGIFLRTAEQQVLVYPSPVASSFIQGRDQKEAHQLVLTGEEGLVAPGSIAAHVEQQYTDGKHDIVQDYARNEAIKLTVDIPNGKTPGRYTWWGWVYATENFSNRELVFELPERSFVVVAELQLDRNLDEFRLQQIEKAKAEEQQRLEQERQQEKATAVKLMFVGNLAIILLVVGGIIFWRKRKLNKASSEQELSLPPS